MSAADLHPCFRFSKPNKDVLLARDRAVVRVSNKSFTGPGAVYLRFLPTTGIEIRIRLDNAPFLGFSKDVDSVLLKGRNIDIPGFATKVTVSSKKGGTKLTWTPKAEPLIALGDYNTSINSVVFHLFNFKSIIGTSRSMETVGNTTHAIEHVDLTCADWRVELRSLHSTHETFNELAKHGGFGLTHIGRIEKTDRSSFTGKEAEEMLKALRLFFSFAKGVWCEPVCTVGFDEVGRHVWELWSSPRDPWYCPNSWFDPRHCEQLTGLFAGFMERWGEENWRDVLHEVIYWYLNSNYSSRGIDAGIILTQAAIERLSYEVTVKEKRLIGTEGFKTLRSSDKFRLLFSSLDIPLDIPNETPELQRLASDSQMNWLDAPHALTEIRNSLVHPEHKWRGHLGNAYYEAWNLGLWYLEMSILAVCGYSGTYGNRLKQRWIGDVEDVPWRK